MSHKITKCQMSADANIGGGTVGPHGSRPPHFYFWEGLASHF